MFSLSKKDRWWTSRWKNYYTLVTEAEWLENWVLGIRIEDDEREGFMFTVCICINNHFNTESYDYFKYNGKENEDTKNFKRNDKYHFAK